KEGADVVVKVADNGIGISEKDQGRIFSRFFRGRNAFEKEPEGTGLGLHLARNIVKAHNGEITFLSEEGKGTVFTITLPFGTL
ncbi:MAG TPA: ATP-binding protein, partial [Candidatus Paceibacterota bacterium]